MNIESLHQHIQSTMPNICQLTALKGASVILSDTWNGYSHTDTTHVMSVTKSVVSILVGIAMDMGLIQSVDQHVLDFFPGYKIKRGEKTIQQVTLRHLLTMTAPYKYKSEPWTKVCTSDDWTAAALDLLGGRSGITGEYKYSTLGIHILNGIIAKESGMTTVDFANRYLFEPLGMAEKHGYLAADAAEHKAFIMNKGNHGDVWFVDPKDVGTAGYGLCISADDLAKLGQMCLSGGIYNGRRIVSEAWIRESTRTHLHCDIGFGDMQYGYLWWVIDDGRGAYAALGNSGNTLYISKADDLVIAVTTYFKPSVNDMMGYIKKTIIPSLQIKNANI